MSHGHREPLKGGDEYDAFTRWRKVIAWGRGELARIKQKFSRRVRRKARVETKRESGS